MKIVSYNVNGFRAFARKGGWDRLATLEADIVCLQEVRATAEQIAKISGHEWGGLPLRALESGTLAGRNGVALCLAPEPMDVVTALPGFDDEGRWLEGLVATSQGPVRVVSVYVPTGEAETPKQEHKMAFLAQMTERMDGFMKEAADGGMQTVVCGDLNIARTDADLKNWKGNRGKSGVLPDERAVLESWADKGWVDVASALAGPDANPAYTWWAMRGRAFDNDAGWRIDAQWATPDLAALARSAHVDRPPSWDSRWSDHAALTIDYDLRVVA